MNVRSALKWTFAFAFLALAAGNADAQPAGGANGSAPGAPNGAGATTEGQVGFQRKTSLTPQEQLVESQKHLSRMDAAAGSVRKMLEEARRQRDVVKTLCLNDKLSQIDVAVRSARDRKTQLQEAVNRSDAELSNHEFTIMTVLRQRTEQLVAEANQCIGEESAFIGDTKTTVQVDPEIPPDDTPYPPTDPTIVIGRPPCTSCTQ
jgi:hypothetical protein